MRETNDGDSSSHFLKFVDTMKTYCSSSTIWPVVIAFLTSTSLVFVFILISDSSSGFWWPEIQALKHDPFTETMIFEEHDQYMSLAPKNDIYWDDLLTPNGGFVKRPDANGVVMKHGMSMFHQLHCLQMIRAEIQRLMHLQRENRNHHIDHILDDEAHWTHCLDYIRQVSRFLIFCPEEYLEYSQRLTRRSQGILCAADSTIESPRKNGDGRTIVDGNATEHKCRNSRELYEISGV